jgi:hypothetical protein
MDSPRHALCTAALLVAASCGLVREVAETPGRLANPPPAAASIDLDAVREEALRYADRIVDRIDVAALRFAATARSAQDHELSLTWRITAAERAYQLAAQARPVAALADLVALCTYERRLFEAYWMVAFDERGRPLLEAWQTLEEDGLATAERLLPAQQSKDLRAVMTDWSASVTDTDQLLRTGPPRFEELAGKRQATAASRSLLGVVGLDPLDSLEPAAREVAQARELAERAVFLAQRALRTAAWRLELLTRRLADQPASQQLLADMERVSMAAEQATAMANVLPERISHELSEQRAGLVADLERVSEPTRALLAQAQATLEAGTRLAEALDVATKSVDAFVAQVAPPEPVGEAPSDEPPGKPFDPVEYTELAAQVTAGLQELNAAAASLDRNLPAAQRAVDDAAQRLDRSVERAYGLALRLVLIAIGATAAAVLLVRALRPREARGKPGSPG